MSIEYMIWLPHSNRWVKDFSTKHSEEYMNELTSSTGEAGSFDEEMFEHSYPGRLNDIFKTDEPFLLLRKV